MLNKSKEHKALQTHLKTMRTQHMRDLFAEDPQRFERFHIKLDGLLFDYSKHLITEKTRDLLIALAQASSLESFRDHMFAGDYINTSEDRAVLHTALRGSVDDSLHINGESIADYVASTLHKIEQLSTILRTTEQITDIVCVGMGGSIIGPRMVCEALQSHRDEQSLQIHFIDNIDGAPLARLLDKLEPAQTVFLIASKTFSTAETMQNAAIIKTWLADAVGLPHIANHLIGITEHVKAAKDFGILDDHILPMREWIGGRYSLWSGMGLPIAISIGFEKFKALLDGARAADQHFATAPLEQNIPVITGLLGLWYRNYLGFSAHAILPYAQDLSALPIYVQQLDMESNGKSVNREGKAVDYATSPIVFGGPGTGAQHAFFQLLHQGSDIIPADFIAAITPEHHLGAHHTSLLANALAQTQALMHGHGNKKEPDKHCPGNRPSSMILLEQLDAYHLGMLLALYEHKTIVQGCLWDINSFDQWGVELGKKLALDITHTLKQEGEAKAADSSTQNLLNHIKNVQNNI
jgi:glucose-6-phosphate isomerase